MDGDMQFPCSIKQGYPARWIILCNAYHVDPHSGKERRRSARRGTNLWMSGICARSSSAGREEITEVESRAHEEDSSSECLRRMLQQSGLSGI
jgi:hypothetical protein